MIVHLPGDQSTILSVTEMTRDAGDAVIEIEATVIRIMRKVRGLTDDIETKTHGQKEHAITLIPPQDLHGSKKMREVTTATGIGVLVDLALALLGLRSSLFMSGVVTTHLKN